MNKSFSLILKYFFPFISWFLGVYITLFFMCFYAHVNESNIIANRADALITEITHNKSSLGKVASVQNMVRKTKPSFLEPSTIVNSLFGKREAFKIINKILGSAIVSRKYGLAGLSLVSVDLEGADLRNADMHGAYLKKTNLSEANLSGANLISSQLNQANLSHANLKGSDMGHSHFGGANFEGADLGGANLKRVVGLTCMQFNSAVIDESTRLPDYIFLAVSTGTTFKCINLKKGKGVDLSRANMANRHLFGMDLRKSILSRANFEKADLSYTNFLNADLGHANLKGTNLVFSTFKDANLTGSDLRGADLDHAAGLTCEQVKSAVIDESTRLPSYISLECENSQAVKTVGEK
jgi:uncharacterized protein YjbI with pentapeptide repeats